MTRILRQQHWLINSRSGNGAGGRLREALQGISGVSAHAIAFHDLAGQMRAIPSDALIVVAGGDGTFSSVFGIPEARDREVACVPLGTANDLARELSIPRCLRGARYQDYPRILEGLSFRRCAVWTARVDGREHPFINYISIGYEGAVVRDFASWRSRTSFRGRLGNRIAYTVFGLKHSFVRLRNLTLTNQRGASHSVRPTTGVIITNIKSHLGMALSNGESDMSDEIIEAVPVSNVLGFPRMMLAGTGLPCGLSPSLQGGTITIGNIPSGTPIQIDGETAPSVQSGELTVTLRHFVQIASAK